MSNGHSNYSKFVITDPVNPKFVADDRTGKENVVCIRCWALLFGECFYDANQGKTHYQYIDKTLDHAYYCKLCVKAVEARQKA